MPNDSFTDTQLDAVSFYLASDATGIFSDPVLFAAITSCKAKGSSDTSTTTSRWVYDPIDGCALQQTNADKQDCHADQWSDLLGCVPPTTPGDTESSFEKACKENPTFYWLDNGCYRARDLTEAQCATLKLSFYNNTCFSSSAEVSCFEAGNYWFAAASTSKNCRAAAKLSEPFCNLYAPTLTWNTTTKRCATAAPLVLTQIGVGTINPPVSVSALSLGCLPGEIPDSDPNFCKAVDNLALFKGPPGGATPDWACPTPSPTFEMTFNTCSTSPTRGPKSFYVTCGSPAKPSGLYTVDASCATPDATPIRSGPYTPVPGLALLSYYNRGVNNSDLVHFQYYMVTSASGTYGNVNLNGQPTDDSSSIGLKGSIHARWPYSCPTVNNGYMQYLLGVSNAGALVCGDLSKYVHMPKCNPMASRNYADPDHGCNPIDPTKASSYNGSIDSTTLFLGFMGCLAGETLNVDGVTCDAVDDLSQSKAPKLAPTVAMSATCPSPSPTFEMSFTPTVKITSTAINSTCPTTGGYRSFKLICTGQGFPFPGPQSSCAPWGAIPPDIKSGLYTPVPGLNLTFSPVSLTGSSYLGGTPYTTYYGSYAVNSIGGTTAGWTAPTGAVGTTLTSFPYSCPAAPNNYTQYVLGLSAAGTLVCGNFSAYTKMPECHSLETRNYADPNHGCIAPTSAVLRAAYPANQITTTNMVGVLDTGASILSTKCAVDQIQNFVIDSGVPTSAFGIQCKGVPTSVHFGQTSSALSPFTCSTGTFSSLDVYSSSTQIVGYILNCSDRSFFSHGDVLGGGAQTLSCPSSTPYVVGLNVQQNADKSAVTELGLICGQWVL